ncbi:cysteine hydrolase [Janthinobacterium agaricidamnosum]|uniref:Cysteine hydrolase n=1 Tax=Janthinobacterium agaricidamnosum NBRC 102515 = DSM 9628 TaxID=1349767 RepID=W0V7B0_9BURK|nr:cysteine hydrolase [Janthinobacterium agaricidamnosum]CDG84724.1 putative uncharacterized protein [Janthinobacterium agaricidamnosum NBRC 102515 = DSM 9628]
MKRPLHLLVIDPQNDFCDLPAAYLPLDPLNGQPRAPSLPVPGAHQDMRRVASLIRRGAAGLTAITVTLDSHHRYDIAHPVFWRHGDGRPVLPFTPIRAEDVRQQKFLPRKDGALPRVLAYLDALEAAGRYTLMVWPVHCEIGSWGHNVHDDVRSACDAWEEAALGIAAKVSKGSNPWTEHYSAVMAEVPDADDPATQFNVGLVENLNRSAILYICGEASSHCVKATTEHIADYVEQQGGRAALSKLVLLTDCMSPVSGFEDQHHAFLRDMAARGLRLAHAEDILPELLNNAGR